MVTVQVVGRTAWGAFSVVSLPSAHPSTASSGEPPGVPAAHPGTLWEGFLYAPTPTGAEPGTGPQGPEGGDEERAGEKGKEEANNCPSASGV